MDKIGGFKELNIVSHTAVTMLRGHEERGNDCGRFKMPLIQVLNTLEIKTQNRILGILKLIEI